MIKLLCILLAVTHINGQNLVYLLPDEKSIFESWLHSHIKRSTKPIFIFSDSLNHSTLKKSLIVHQSHGHELTMVVSHLENNPLELIQYQNTHLFHYQARRVHGSLILMEPFTCQITLPLNQELLTTMTSTIICTDDLHTFNTAMHAFSTLQKRSSNYLK